MTEPSETEIDNLDEVRKFLNSDLGYRQQILIQSLFNQFMSETKRVLQLICIEIGHSPTSYSQGHAKCDYNTGTFASNFGMTLSKIEFFPRITGNLVGDELVIMIQDDETIISRFNANTP